MPRGIRGLCDSYVGGDSSVVNAFDGGGRLVGGRLLVSASAHDGDVRDMAKSTGTGVGRGTAMLARLCSMCRRVRGIATDSLAPKTTTQHLICGGTRHVSNG